MDDGLRTERLPSEPMKRPGIWLIVLAYAAFITLGMPDGLLGVAWPSMREYFGQPLDALGMLLFAGMAGYVSASFFCGPLASRLGVGNLLAASCGAAGLGIIGYTLVPAWWMLVALGAFAGLGAGAIDAGLNTYVAANHGEGTMQWLHASFGIGITLGPLIMTTGINVFGTWRLGYVVGGAAKLALAICFVMTASLWRREACNSGHEENQAAGGKASILETLRQPSAWLSMLMFFVYTGIELTLGYWVYTLLTESRGISPGAAGLWTGSYWAMFTIGRLLAGVYTSRFGTHTLLTYGLIAALGGAALLWWNPAGAASLAGVAIVGFAIAPIFPGLVSGTDKRVGARHAANAIGMQIGAAGLGSAVLPAAAGFLARRFTLEIIPVYLTFTLVMLLALYAFSRRHAAG